MRELSAQERGTLDFLAWRAWNRITDPTVRRAIYGSALPHEDIHARSGPRSQPRRLTAARSR